MKKPERRNRIIIMLALTPIIVVILVATFSRLIAYGRSTAPASVTSTPGPITHHVFLSSIKENGAENGEHATPNLVIFPLLQGISHDKPVWYVITESSDKADAMARGVNFSSKLANAKGTPAVQMVTMENGMIDFPATVAFGLPRVIESGATGFPPVQASPPAMGEAAYSPLIELPNGIVLNAPQIANGTGHADKVVSLDTKDMRVTYRETMGFYEDKLVHYVSFDSSSPVAAAIEDVTYAPALGMAPIQDNEDPKTSAREKLLAFVNGQAGATNPNRQGLNSTLLDGLDPFNILHKAPQDVPDYSPLWDVHFVAWTDAAIKNGQNTRQIDFDDVMSLIQQGLVTGPGGQAVGPAGFIVNCPIMSVDLLPGQQL